MDKQLEQQLSEGTEHQTASAWRSFFVQNFETASGDRQRVEEDSAGGIGRGGEDLHPERARWPYKGRPRHAGHAGTAAGLGHVGDRERGFRSYDEDVLLAMNEVKSLTARRDPTLPADIAVPSPRFPPGQAGRRE